ncbi:hypothetical protein CQW23_07364 [Capsicum baccatum]|uniref:Uncharacterized protein n=1 Tax=Capsicum baccatum TaxID=33114 RepID=A0A2G2X5Y0_CAPBA|nr:hypothetical protein CQW23_07364 [Capsicum baccatum]
MLLLLDTLLAAEATGKVEAEDFEKLAKELQIPSALEIMDKALEKFGDDIAIAFSANGIAGKNLPVCAHRPIIWLDIPLVCLVLN